MMGEDPTGVEAIAAVLACPPATAAHVAARSQPRHYAAAQTVLPQGEPTARSWLVLAGHARAQHITMDGRPLTLGDYLPGDLFGAVLEALARAPAEVQAVLPTDTRVMAPADLLALLEQHPSLGLAVSRALLRQVNALAGQMVMAVGMSAMGRLCVDIRLKADAEGRICPLPNITSWALRLTMARETLSRNLSTLERRQIVVRDDDGLCILDPRRLRELEY